MLFYKLKKKKNQTWRQKAFKQKIASFAADFFRLLSVFPEICTAETKFEETF